MRVWNFLVSTSAQRDALHSKYPKEETGRTCHRGTPRVPRRLLHPRASRTCQLPGVDKADPVCCHGRGNVAETALKGSYLVSTLRFQLLPVFLVKTLGCGDFPFWWTSFARRIVE